MKILKNNGITLIALIITIIVLLILAVVAINSVNGDGIISYAQKAKENYTRVTENENMLLTKYEALLNNINNQAEEKTLIWDGTYENAVTIVESFGLNKDILYKAISFDKYVFKYSSSISKKIGEQLEKTGLRCLIGDVDGDGLITVIDTSLIRAMIEGEKTYDERQVDLNKDGSINQGDISIIRNIIAGMIHIDSLDYYNGTKYVEDK